MTLGAILIMEVENGASSIRTVWVDIFAIQFRVFPRLSRLDSFLLHSSTFFKMKNYYLLIKNFSGIVSTVRSTTFVAFTLALAERHTHCRVY